MPAKYKVYTKADPGAPYNIVATGFAYALRQNVPVVEFTDDGGGIAAVFVLMQIDAILVMRDPE